MPNENINLFLINIFVTNFKFLTVEPMMSLEIWQECKKSQLGLTLRVEGSCVVSFRTKSLLRELYPLMGTTIRPGRIQKFKVRGIIFLILFYGRTTVKSCDGRPPPDACRDGWDKTGGDRRLRRTQQDGTRVPLPQCGSRSPTTSLPYTVPRSTMDLPIKNFIND